MFCKQDIVIQFQNMDIIRVGKVLGLQRFVKGGNTTNFQSGICLKVFILEHGLITRGIFSVNQKSVSFFVQIEKSHCSCCFDKEQSYGYYFVPDCIVDLRQLLCNATRWSGSEINVSIQIFHLQCCQFYLRHIMKQLCFN